MDILLTRDGDLRLTGQGDISLTDSIRQAVRIRLLWFFGEWRFSPDWGLPYFERVLVKNPSIGHIRQIVREEIMAVEGVTDVRSVNVSVDSKRGAVIEFIAAVGDEEFREEITIYERIRPDA